MRTENMRSSQNVEDRRGRGGGFGGGGGGPKLAVGGVGGIILVLVIILLGGNPQQLLQGQGSGTSATSATPGAQTQQEVVVRKVLGDTEDVWNQLFSAMGKRYEEPGLVLFNGGVRSACGLADSAVGPFYCPGDGKIYIDLDFYQELAVRFKAPGDFAQAYVVAHEVGHHVQNLLGISDRMRAQQERTDERGRNMLSVRLELQADYLAGVWAHHANKQRQILEPGDIDEGLAAAAAVGDDRLQKQARGYVVPDSFTHGTSAQRIEWFKKGFESGDPFAFDPFRDEH